ncbi:hypothetical protein MPTK1_4g14990 [Marchantia polymorpha subsp. ruderalis]|uniref:Uncharacterized protein n=2 Tax=Marchantia polymorpha TaxID=3197 RepID=A0AAF6BA19_MARPO|nr:hypothetical protein MARPO_0119s0022 [Marchantia polymorpha]BBN08853.1 hypothetical protein Mp_4g14990 [Marchantia polymorpha subsp. ruderalis]|eukprot:PTQ30818.1 hypothetical protein MARPO_0119s0022 [Marchantia polymorpha]
MASLWPPAFSRRWQMFLLIRPGCRAMCEGIMIGYACAGVTQPSSRVLSQDATVRRRYFYCSDCTRLFII